MQNQVLTPQELQIGMRISIHPHANDFESIILETLEETTRRVQATAVDSALAVSTDDVATYVAVTAGDPAQLLAEYAATLIQAAAVASHRQYLACHILLSRGSQGIAEDQNIAGRLPTEKAVFLPTSGLPVSAAWSLYPLSDAGVPSTPAIHEAIEQAKVSGVQVSSDPFVTKLQGDLSVVLAVMFDAWTAAGKEIPHVVSHATISVDPFLR